jgi:hypothetical protein
MSRTAFFPGLASHPVRPAPPQAQAARRAPVLPVSGLAQAYPWLPAEVRNKLGARARRLMRADY